MCMITDDQICPSSKEMWGTPQCFRDMLFGAFAKIRQYGVYIYFSYLLSRRIWIALQKLGNYTSIWRKFIRQAVNVDTKFSYLKGNPGTTACQIMFFKNWWGKIIVSGMDAIGQILDYDDRKEYQGRGAQRFHAPIYVKNS